MRKRLPRLPHSALWALAALGLNVISCSGARPTGEPATAAELAVGQKERARAAPTIYPGEVHFESLQQLTFSGENAEAYFDATGSELIFQSTRDGFQCDQIFRMGIDGSNPRLVSTGLGRTTCSFIFPGQDKILYSSSHATLKTCPPKPDRSRGYVWPLLADLEIYVAGAEGESPTAIAPYEGYDAEAVLSNAGDRIVFTSTRSGDIDIWSMAPDGKDLKQLTTEVGYDGGPFFSPDGTKIVYRAHHPSDPATLADYKSLLAANLVRPSVMDLMVMDADGSNKRAVLANGAANFAPYFHPDGARIVFSSNMDDPGGRNFDLYLIGVDGTGLERITYNDTFDAFPMFNRDGTLLVFASNRNAAKEGDTNVFVARWRDDRADAFGHARLEGAAEIDPATWRQRAGELASGKYGGRGMGTKELDAAAARIAAEMKTMGLEPGGDAGSFLQKLEIPVGGTLGRVAFATGKGAATPAEARPFPFSGSGKVSAKAVFVGYGITSAEHDYDDYAGVDAAGKVAVAFRYEPGRHDAASKLNGVAPVPMSDLRFKAINARHHGAVALVVINPPVEGGETDELYDFGDGATAVGIPVVHVSWAAAARLFDRDRLDGARRSIDAARPTKAELETTISMDFAIERSTVGAANVVGKLPANHRGTSDGKPLPAVVIGAHYDHLGMGGDASLAHGVEAPHVGADDNASGVAAMLEIAEALASVKRTRDVYVVAFTAEESGLLGSRAFVDQFEGPQGKFAAMLNFDMVGRMRDQRLVVLGAGTAQEMAATVRRSASGLPVNLVLEMDGYGPSDQTSFYASDIPVLQFFTGVHEDYHRPSDTADKLVEEGGALVSTLGFRIANAIASGVAPMTFRRVRSRAAGDSGGTGRRGYGPYFGSIPAFGKSGVSGVPLSGAKAGSPAANAGIIAGDVIVKFGKFDITSLQDYAFAMRQHKPGDEVDVVVDRDGKRVTLVATLGARKKPGTRKKSASGTHPGKPHE